ncbi:MAG: SpoIIE family protein phosphatase [Chloroflexi bacterium]|nr:SpoIIE family protein phosphatase [Chloroflexota bacterium]
MIEQPHLDKIGQEHLLTLYTITRTINSSLDFDEVLNTVMDSVMQVTRAQRGFLMVAEDDPNHMDVRVARGLTGETIQSEARYSTSVVNEVVATRQPLLTNNAQYDGRYKVGQSIIMQGLRAILCAPMMVRDRLIGVVYVDSSIRNNNFKEEDLLLLNAVAGQAAVAIENARLYRLAVERGRIDREIQMAREIQESLLPRKTLNIPGYQIAAQWRSAREMAGDFYDLFPLSDDTFGVVIADVSDKGIPAALFMASARSMVRTHAFAGLSAVETLARTNDLLVEDTESGMFVTVYYSTFHPDGQVRGVNAGHNPPLFCRPASDSAQYLPRGGRALGWFPNNPLHTIDLQMQLGDVIVYYTDGLTDAENPRGDFFGEARLLQVVRKYADGTADELLAAIEKAVDDFCCGLPAFDDLTLCVVRYIGA